VNASDSLRQLFREVRVSSYSRDGLTEIMDALGGLTNTFNADNEMTAFNGTALSYDPNGNLTADGTNTYTWDARNHMIGISGGLSANFAYDATGRRASKTINGTTTQFLYYRLNPVQELDGANPPNVTANLLRGLGIDEHLSRTDSSGAMSLLRDALGSTLALTDSTGALNTQHTYQPFGATTASSPSNANPYQFTARENDGTGLDFFRARYYSSSNQRFTAQDPLQFIWEDLNLYAYVKNAPPNRSDPTGKQDIPILPPPPEPLPPGIYNPFDPFDPLCPAPKIHPTLQKRYDSISSVDKWLLFCNSLIKPALRAQCKPRGLGI